MITEQHWFVVYERRGTEDVPIAAFRHEEQATLPAGATNWSVLQRPVFIGDVERKCMRLLRDIVRPDFTPEDDRRMQRAIDAAKKLFGYD